MAIKKSRKTPHFVKYGHDLQAVRKKIEKYFDKWVVVLGLQTWNITVDYNAWPHEEDKGCWADCTPSWEYKNAHINFYLHKFREAAEEEVEGVIIHELIHALICETRHKDFCEENVPHEERVVTELTSAFLRAKRR